MASPSPNTPGWPSLPWFELEEQEVTSSELIFGLISDKTTEDEALVDIGDVCSCPSLTSNTSSDTSSEPITPETEDANTQDMPGQQREEPAHKELATKANVRPTARANKRRRSAKRNCQPKKQQLSALRLAGRTTFNSASNQDVYCERIYNEDVPIQVHVGSTYRLSMVYNGDGEWGGKDTVIEVWTDRDAMKQVVAKYVTDRFQYRWLDGRKIYHGSNHGGRRHL